MKVTIELKMARGWRIWIDGKEPTSEWVIGECDDDGREFTLTKDGEPLKVGDHTISWVRFDVPEQYWCPESKPEMVDLNLDGFITIGKATEVVWGDPDGATPLTYVKMFNGKALELDEITSYVRIEVEV